MTVVQALGRPMLFCVLIAHVVLAFVFVVRQSGALVPLELIAYDLMLRARPAANADSRVAVIRVTEPDLQRYGFPLSDDVIAQTIERILINRPKVVGIDIYRDLPVGTGGTRLEAVLAGNRNIVWVSKFGDADHPGVPPPKLLAGTDQVGFNDILDDAGGVVRRGLLFLDDGRDPAYSFPLRLALLYAGKTLLGPAPDNSEHARLGAVTIRPLESNDGGYVGADTRGYQFLLDYEDMPGAYANFTLSQVLEPGTDLAELTGRVVLIGSAAKSVNDFFYTPYSGSLGPDQRIYGVELHARVVSQLLRLGVDGKRPMAWLSDFQEYALVWLWCLLGALVAPFAHSLLRFLAAGILGLTAILAGALAAVLNALWLPLVPMALAFVATGALSASYVAGHHRRERSIIMSLFARHVSAEVAEALWRSRDEFMEGGRPLPRQLIATVLATDIKGFTSISEKMEAPALMSWLNEYMDAMATLVRKHGGIVDKYIGDAVMAVFGVPIPRQDRAQIALDARRAVDCALDMELELARLNLQWSARGLPRVGLRAGIFTGPLVAGSLGSADRLAYTVIGDTVNTAFRLESLVLEDGATIKEVDRMCRIIVGESTRELLPEGYITVPMGAVDLKGKAWKIEAHYVLKRVSSERDAGGENRE